MGTQAEIPPVLDFIPREEVRGPREKPAQAFAALPADEALAVGHTSLRWAFPSWIHHPWSCSLQTQPTVG